MMWAMFALITASLTSELPMCNKRLWRDTKPLIVAGVIKAASIALLVGLYE